MSEHSDSFHVRCDRIEHAVEWLEASSALGLVLPRVGALVTVLVAPHHVGSVIAANRHTLVYYEFLDGERVTARLYEGPRELAHLERSFEDGSVKFDARVWIKQRVIDRAKARALERGLEAAWPERSERHWVADALGLHDVTWASGEELMTRRRELVERFPGSILVEAGDPRVDAPRPRPKITTPPPSPTVIVSLTPPVPMPAVEPPASLFAPASLPPPPPPPDPEAPLFRVVPGRSPAPPPPIAPLPSGAAPRFRSDHGAIAPLPSGAAPRFRSDHGAIAPLPSGAAPRFRSDHGAIEPDELEPDELEEPRVERKRSLSVLDEIEELATETPPPRRPASEAPLPEAFQPAPRRAASTSAYAHLPLSDEFTDEPISPRPRTNTPPPVRARTIVLCTVSRARLELLEEDPRLVDALLDARFEESIPGLLDLGPRVGEVANVLASVGDDLLEALRATTARPIPDTQARLLDRRAVVRVASYLRRIDVNEISLMCRNPRVAEDLRELIRLYTEAAQNHHAMLIAVDWV